MIIALVRHGETDWNREQRWQGLRGAPLNDLGRWQAAAAAPLLADRSWSWMITSPLERAAETGGIIADALPAVPISTDHTLVERDYGEADGVYAHEAARRWPDGRFPGMESDEEVGRRGPSALRRIASAQRSDGIVVAHGSLIRMLINVLCDTDAPRILNGSINLVGFDGARWRALGFNQVGDPDSIVPAPTTGS